MLRLRAQRAAWLILGCVAGLIAGCGRDASPATTPVTGDNGGDAGTVDGNGGNAGGAGGGNSGAGGGGAVDAAADMRAATPCHTDDACAGSTPRCDVTSGRCVAC